MNTNQAKERHQNCGGQTSELMPVIQGQQRILSEITPLARSEAIDVQKAQGRILATDVISPINVPAYNNSAMDGYAVASQDLPTEGEARLRIAGRVLAGHPFEGELKSGECVEIMTGAQVPDVLDTIIIKEVCTIDSQPNDINQVIFPAGAKPGQNRRMAGEDLSIGSVAVGRGTRLGAADLGLIASLGQAKLDVLRKPRVAYFSTGDEIRSLGEPLESGQIYDSNRYTIIALLEAMNVEVLDLGVIADQREAVEEAFLQASNQADMILSSGGVSLGEADFVKETLDKLGQVNFWRLAIKPGRPLAFGRVRDSLFFGLPGNPVAAMVTFLQFVKPALAKLAGETDIYPHSFEITCAEKLKKRPGRTEYLRGICSINSDGELQVKTTGHQGSGILTSMSQANCLIVLESERGNIEIGDKVRVQPFNGLM